MTEAKLVPAENGGLVPGDAGWFVLNARDARWLEGTLGAYCAWEGPDAGRFPQVGINLNVLEPGMPMAMYHRENSQEDFLVLAGECVVDRRGRGAAAAAMGSLPLSARRSAHDRRGGGRAGARARRRRARRRRGSGPRVPGRSGRAEARRRRRQGDVAPLGGVRGNDPRLAHVRGGLAARLISGIWYRAALVSDTEAVWCQTLLFAIWCQTPRATGPRRRRRTPSFVAVTQDELYATLDLELSWSERALPGARADEARAPAAPVPRQVHPAARRDPARPLLRAGRARARSVRRLRDDARAGARVRARRDRRRARRVQLPPDPRQDGALRRRRSRRGAARRLQPDRVARSRTRACAARAVSPRVVLAAGRGRAVRVPRPDRRATSIATSCA